MYITHNLVFILIKLRLFFHDSFIHSDWHTVSNQPQLPPHPSQRRISDTAQKLSVSILSILFHLQAASV